MAAERNYNRSSRYDSYNTDQKIYANYKYYVKPAVHTAVRSTNAKPASKPIKPEPVRTPEIDMKISPPKRGSVVKIFFAAGSALLILFSVIYGKAETDKMSRQISDANAYYDKVKSENVRLQSELESKMTLKNIEEYAVNVLGLNKLDNSQIEYVQTHTDDAVEIPEEEKSVFVKIKDKIDAFVEYIFG